tara:strand:+ start:101 stop:469 length:369 start_codon:yes stop_codon:yes gene_type:complete
MKNYCPELDNGSDSDYEQISSETSSGEEEDSKVVVAPISKEIKKDDILKELLNLGDLRTDNILEVQYILKLIHESNMTELQKQTTGSCLSMLLNLSNLYLKYYSTLQDKEIEEGGVATAIKD